MTFTRLSLLALACAGVSLAHANSYQLRQTSPGMVAPAGQPAYPANPCTLPWGGTLADGATYSGSTVYSASFVNEPATCTDVVVSSLSCTNGALSLPTATNSCTTKDPSWSNVNVLMHLDNFTDQKSHTVATNNVSIGSITGMSGTGAALLTGSGSSSFSVSSAAAPGNTFTFETWLYPTGVGGTYNLIWDNRGVVNSASGIGLFIMNDYSLRVGWTGSNYDLTTSSKVTLNAWNHLALVRNGADLKLFLNGTAVAQTTTFSRTLSDTAFLIGRAIDLSYGYKGYIDELRYTPGVARYSNSFTPYRGYANN